MNKNPLENKRKIAFVTGVSGYLGSRIAEYLLREDWDVWGLSRAKSGIANEHFSWIEADLANSRALVAAIAPVPSVDAIIHAAGAAGPVGSGLELSMEGWRETFEVNFFAPLALTQRLLARAEPGACTIFFSGGGAANPRALVGPYAVSKLAVVKLAEQFAIEHSKFRFYAIAPGAHDSKLFREHHEKTGETRPRLAEFDDVERLLRTLLADTEGKLNGKFIHVRDDLERISAVFDGGRIRRVEGR